MDRAAYEAEAGSEATHWWYLGRRKLIESVVREIGCSAATSALDVGTASGGNIRLLKEIGLNNVSGLDYSPVAVKYCRSKGHGRALVGDARHMPFGAERFGLVLATDTIEHIQDDLGTLREIHRVLCKGGHAIVTVPAFPSLMGQGDIIAQHIRRYRRVELMRLINESGLELMEIFHFNYLLFLPIFLARRLILSRGKPPVSELKYNTPWLNRLLRYVFYFDVATARWLKPCFGVSLFAVCRKDLYPPSAPVQ